MSKAVKTLYWDTSVFLCFLDANENEKRKICEDILHHARDGHVVIATSTFTIVETIRPKWIVPASALTPEQIRIIEGMFKWPWIKKYQVDERLALRAVALARDYALKPGDSIHAATAIAAKVDVLQQWDRDFQKIAHLVTVAQPAYETKQMELLEIGPTQLALEEAGKPTIGPAPLPSTETAPPSAQSPDAGKGKETAPAQSRRAVHLDGQEPLQPGSSPAAAPPPPSKK